MTMRGFLALMLLWYNLLLQGRVMNPSLGLLQLVDAIPYSGKYDGGVGVLGAIEAINVLKRAGFKAKQSLEVIVFPSEEPTRFGINCLGRCH